MSSPPQLGEAEYSLDDLLADCEELFPTPTRSDAGSIIVSKTWSTCSAVPDNSQKYHVTKETKKSWHQRRKEEILSLRKLVTQLSADLVRCKAAVGVNLASSLPIMANQTSTAQKWRTLAEMEFTRRQTSEKENVKLRKEVHLNILQAKALRRSARRKLHKSIISSSTSQLVHRGVWSPRYNTSIFNELIAGMDAVYAGLNGFFDRIKMHDLPCPGQRNDAEKNRPSGLFVNLLECYAVPFDLRATEKAVWALTTTPAGDQENVEAQYYDAGSNTRMKTLSICIAGDGLKIRLVVHVAVRKYVEQDRTVLVLRVFVEPIPEIFNVAFRETSRIVLKRGEPSLTGPTTVLQRNCRVTDHEGLSSCRRAHPGWKTSSYYYSSARSWETSFSDLKHRVEDMLLHK